MERVQPTSPKPSRSVVIRPDSFAMRAIEHSEDSPIPIFPTCVSGDADAHSKYLCRVVSEVKTDAAHKFEFKQS